MCTFFFLINTCLTVTYISSFSQWWWKFKYINWQNKNNINFNKIIKKKEAFIVVVWKEKKNVLLVFCFVEGKWENKSKNLHTIFIFFIFFFILKHLLVPCRSSCCRYYYCHCYLLYSIDAVISFIILYYYYYYYFKINLIFWDFIFLYFVALFPLTSAILLLFTCCFSLKKKSESFFVTFVFVFVILFFYFYLHLYFV